MSNNKTINTPPNLNYEELETITKMLLEKTIITCADCGKLKPVAAFKSIDNKPVCAECFINKYNKIFNPESENGEENNMNANSNYIVNKLDRNDEIAELLKSKFNFKSVNINLLNEEQDIEENIEIEVSYDGENYKILLLYPESSNNEIIDLFETALFNNKWRDKYTLHSNSKILQKIFDEYCMNDYYFISQNELYKIDFETDSGDCLIDMTETIGISFKIDELGDIDFISLEAPDGKYILTYDNYKFEQNKK